MLLVTGGYIYATGYALENYQVNDIAFSSEKVDDSFDGFTIAHVSDLYLYNEFSEVQLSSLMNEIYTQSPDLLVINGNFISDYENAGNINYEAITTAINEAQVQYGIFYVPAENEVISEELNKALYDANVMILNNECQQIFYDDVNASFNLCGYNDPSLVPEPVPDTLNVLVMNDPDQAKKFSNYDLILTGKNLGNVGFGDRQFEPELNTIIDDEITTISNATLINSSGVGTRTTHVRIFNRPEIQMINLQN